MRLQNHLKNPQDKPKTSFEECCGPLMLRQAAQTDYNTFTDWASPPAIRAVYVPKIGVRVQVGKG
jgi:hypothetical protein